MTTAQSPPAQSSTGKNMLKEAPTKPVIVNPYLSKNQKVRKSGTFKNKTEIPNLPSTGTQHPTTTQPGLTTINEEEESGDISSKMTTTSSAQPTQVDTVSATDDDNDDVDADTPSVVEIPTTAGRRSRVHYQERNKDLPLATISAAKLKLDTVYGDHVHENSVSHLHGGIGAGEDTLWQVHHKSLLPFNAQLYDTPKRKAGKE